MARYYDFLMDVGTLGAYRSFIKKAIAWMGIWPGEWILDMGAGTGRNACLMARYLHGKGGIVGIEIGREMAEQFRNRCRRYPNVSLLERRIDAPFAFKREFDKILLSFVLHGLPHSARERVLGNCRLLLREKGELVLFDYNEFDLSDLPFYLRLPFVWGECPYAFEFVKLDLEAFLGDYGFSIKEEQLFFRGMVRCVKAVRLGERTV